MKRMRIAIVADRFPEISETFILNHVTGLLDLGHEVDVFVFGRSKTAQCYAQTINKYKLTDRIHFYQFPKNKALRVLTGLFEYVKLSFIDPMAVKRAANFRKYGKYESVNNLIKLRPFLFKKYDCLHCHFGPNANAMAFLKDIFPEMKFLVTFHGYDIRLGFKKGGHIYQELFEKADHILSVSDYNYGCLTRFGCPKSKIVKLGHGVDMDLFKPGRRQAQAIFTITTVARLVEEKNLMFGLKIMKRLKEIIPQKFSYQIIGDGPIRDALLQTIEESGLNDTVKLLGAQPRDKIIEFLGKTDVFLLPSKNEAFSVALLEAQAMEVPVVACNVGGISSAMNDQQTGFLVPLNDVEYTVKTIMKLFDNETLRSSLGKAGRKFVENHGNIKNINHQLEEIYFGNIRSRNRHAVLLSV